MVKREKGKIKVRKEKVRGREIRAGDDPKVRIRSQSHVFSISKRVVVPGEKNVFTVMQRNMVPERIAKVPEMEKGVMDLEMEEVRLRSQRMRSHVSFSLRASVIVLIARISMIAMRLPPRLGLPKLKPLPKGRPKQQQPKRKQQQSLSRSEKDITKTISRTGRTAKIHLR